MMARRIVLGLLIAAGICVFAAGPSASQDYPNHVIKMIVPFPPGGPIDTMARIVAHELSTRLGQEVVVDNRPGAGSTLGSKAAAGADPDGYTLLFGSSGSLAVAPALYAKLNIDPLKLFAPVASVSLLPHVLVVGPSVPAKTVQEFVAYAKANPGKLNYGAGLGTPPHLLSTLLKAKAGIDVTYIPYKGSAASITDLLAGQTHFTIDGLLGLYPLIKEDKLRALGIARAERWPALAAGADAGRKRLSRFHARRLDRGGRAGRDAGQCGQYAQSGHQRRPAVAGDEGEPGAVQRNCEGRHTAGLRRFHAE